MIFGMNLNSLVQWYVNGFFFTGGGLTAIWIFHHYHILCFGTCV